MSDKLYQREQPAASSGKQLPIKQETTKGSASDSEAVGARGVGREREGVGGVWKSFLVPAPPPVSWRGIARLSLSVKSPGETHFLFAKLPRSDS